MPGSSHSAVRPADPTASQDSTEESSAESKASQDGLQKAEGCGDAFVTPADSGEPVKAGLVIHEIGLGLSPLPSSLRANVADDAVEVDAGCDSVVDAEPVLGSELINAVQFLNLAEVAVETDALTIEFLNSDRALVSLPIADGLTVPGGGGLTICQHAGPDADPTVRIQVLNAAGFVLHDIVVADAAAWGLGADTSEPLAVNLVYRAGSDDALSLDTFVANLRRADIAALSSAPDFGVASRTKLISSQNFETYFTDLSTAANVFSRVFEDDSLPEAEAASSLDMAAGSGVAYEPKGMAESAGPLVMGGREGGAVSLVSGKAKGNDGHGGQRHSATQERHLGHKSQQFLKPGSGSLRSGI